MFATVTIVWLGALACPPTQSPPPSSAVTAVNGPLPHALVTLRRCVWASRADGAGGATHPVQHSVRCTWPARSSAHVCTTSGRVHVHAVWLGTWDHPQPFSLPPLLLSSTCSPTASCNSPPPHLPVHRLLEHQRVGQVVDILHGAGDRSGTRSGDVREEHWAPAIAPSPELQTRDS